MSEAPERIWVESECGHANTYNREDRKTWFHFPDNAPDYFYTHYVRADRIEELEAKLAKAVEALRFYAWDNEIRLPSDGPWGAGSTDFGKVARNTLAELTGGKDE